VNKPRYEVLRHGWKKLPWVVIHNIGYYGWELVSHHKTEASARKKLAVMLEDTRDPGVTAALRDFDRSKRVED